MKKRAVRLILFALLLYGAAKLIPGIVGNESAWAWERDVPSLGPLYADAETTTLRVEEAQIYQGDLLLVNAMHPVPAGSPAAEEAVSLFEREELIRGFVVPDRDVRLSPALAERFAAMTAAAAADGVTRFIVSSGFRDVEEQARLYEERGDAYAMPAGHSEHNLGLSLDIGSTQAEMSRAEEGKWLKKHAWKYGFILRYPEDKTEITGIQYEPWHFRYVGLPHSAVMEEKGFALEEYLDFLEERRTYRTTVDGRSYEISYFRAEGGVEIRVPTNGRYELSGDNRAGVIVTAYR